MPKSRRIVLAPTRRPAAPPSRRLEDRNRITSHRDPSLSMTERRRSLFRLPRDFLQAPVNYGTSDCHHSSEPKFGRFNPFGVHKKVRAKRAELAQRELPRMEVGRAD